MAKEMTTLIAWANVSRYAVTSQAMSGCITRSSYMKNIVILCNRHIVAMAIHNILYYSYSFVVLHFTTRSLFPICLDSTKKPLHNLNTLQDILVPRPSNSFVFQYTQEKSESLGGTFELQI